MSETQKKPSSERVAKACYGIGFFIAVIALGVAEAMDAAHPFWIALAAWGLGFLGAVFLFAQGGVDDSDA